MNSLCNLESWWAQWYSNRSLLKNVEILSLSEKEVINRFFGKGFSLLENFFEGKLLISELSFVPVPQKEDEIYHEPFNLAGDELLEFAKHHNCLGSRSFASEIIRVQDEEFRHYLIPTLLLAEMEQSGHFCGIYFVILFPRTVVMNSKGRRFISSLSLKGFVWEYDVVDLDIPMSFPACVLTLK
jgi:hypothetical protein